MQIKLKSKLFEVFLIQNTKTQIKLKSKPFKSFSYSEHKNTRLINYVLKCFYHKHTFHVVFICAFKTVQNGNKSEH